MMEQLPISTNTTPWQIITEFCLPAESDCEQEVNRLILEAIDALESPVSWQNRLSKAIIKAACKAKDRAGVCGEIRVRVMASGKALEGERKDSTEEYSAASGGDDGALIQKSSQGWNFFLIERSDNNQPEDGTGTRDQKQHVVEIFLYIEG